MLWSEGDVIMEEESERCNRAGFGGGGRAHKPRNAGGLQKVGKARKQLLPYSLQKARSSADTLSLAQ